MVFSSPVFIVLFLPLTLALYYLSGRRNYILLLASMVFYAWGEHFFTLLLIISIVINYGSGIIIDRFKTSPFARVFLIFSISANLIFLIHFKYTSFIIDSINPIFVSLGFSTIENRTTHLPLGISFFTFQAITYLVDTYHRKVPAQRNIINLALYISLFPQLIAGPIVRYHEIAKSLKQRTIRLIDLGQGVERFIIGLSKKLILADTLSKPADYIFNLPLSDLSSPLACFGALCFTMQIYFDFSGYSDMAIGLGRMFGFRFPENFNHPYLSRSIREFWHRWHMTLSRFFRDYVYIPIGGNQSGSMRTYVNLTLVFLLCGLWHGANWTFVVWGFYHGLFLLLERTKIGMFLKAAPSYFQRTYVLVVVIMGWIIFRSPSIDYAASYVGSVFSTAGWYNPVSHITSVANNFELFVFATACLFSTSAIRNIKQLFSEFLTPREASSNFYSVISRAGSVGYGFLMAILFVISLSAMSTQTYRAFIYFRF